MIIYHYHDGDDDYVFLQAHSAPVHRLASKDILEVWTTLAIPSHSPARHSRWDILMLCIHKMHYLIFM